MGRDPSGWLLGIPLRLGLVHSSRTTFTILSRSCRTLKRRSKSRRNKSLRKPLFSFTKMYSPSFLFRFNTRFRRNLLERKTRDEKVVERSKYDDVVKENQILDMKLKAAKQQLLIYTAPSARAATASMMTGRSTFRQPPTTWRQRAPLTGGTTGSIDRPPSAPILRK